MAEALDKNSNHSADGQVAAEIIERQPPGLLLASRARLQNLDLAGPGEHTWVIWSNSVCIPTILAGMLEYFRSTWNDDWRAFPTWAFWSWTAFFAAFLLYAWSQHGQALFIDS